MPGLVPNRETETIVTVRMRHGARALRQRVGEFDEPSILDLLERPSWFNDAKCRGVGGNLSHPTTGGRPESSASRLFIRIHCDRCTVKNECLDYALRFEVTTGPTGVWGGYTAFERRRMIRRRRGQPTQTELERRGVELHRQGLSCPAIAQRMGVHERTVQQWVKASRPA